MFKKLDVVFSYVKYFFLSKYGYISIILAFLIWMIFFDSNNYIKRWKLNAENARLRQENVEAQRVIDDNERRINALSNDREALEKYAREKYGMKAPDEDVFLFDE